MDLDVGLSGTLDGDGELLSVSVLGTHGEVSGLSDDATLHNRFIQSQVSDDQ